MSLTATDLKAIAGIVDNSVDKAIETKVRPMFVSLAQQITLLSDATAAGFNQVEERFQQVYARFDAMDQRFERVEGRLVALENDTSRLRGNFSGLLTKVTSIEVNISKIQKDVSRLDSRVTRVEGSVTRIDDKVTKIGGRVSRVEAFLLPPSSKPKAMSGLSRALSRKLPSQSG